MGDIGAYDHELYSFLAVLTPRTEDGTNLSSLDVNLLIQAPDCPAGRVFLTLEKIISNVPCQRYGHGTISASDDYGHLPLTKVDEELSQRQEWTVQRATRGQVSVHVHATPRHVDRNTPIGTRIDLRRDKGGLQGAGTSFIPLPPWGQDNSTCCQIAVEWDLKDVPEATRAIWTFGEGPGRIEATGNLDYYIWNSQYMVGPVLSYPDPARPNDTYGFYWFGSDTPRKIVDIGPLGDKMFHFMSDKFEKDLQQPYRVFIRSSNPAPGFGGTAFSRSYVLEYDDMLDHVDQPYLIWLITHELVHEWLLMGEEEDGLANGWYIEGIANFFGTILPWRFGVLSAAACIKEANSIMEQYYTSPYRSAKERDVDDHWENPLGIVVPYNRGFTFFIKMDALIRDASNGRASLDDVALDLLNQRRSHQIVRQKEWIASVARFLDEELVVRALNDMLEGEIVIPTTITIPGYELHRCDKELLELGFATESLVTRIIAGVVPGSRAAIAGVQNGDKILSSTRLILIFDDFYSCMELELQRGNQKIDVRYWPRASLKVPCWEFRPIESLC